MPIAFTSISGALVGTAIDTNFDNIQNLLREGIVQADIDATGFDKYFLRRWSNGRLSTASAGSNPLLDASYFSRVTQETTVPDIIRARPMQYGLYNGDFARVSRLDLPFELLGFPGPSLIYDMAEYGYDISTKTIKSYLDNAVMKANTALAVATAPSEFMFKHFPATECWSRWLTIPHASMKIYVPEACVVHITGQFSLFPGPGTTTWIAEGAWDPQAILTAWQQQVRSTRIGLFVDTNPEIREDFSNTNPNIKNPDTGATASYVSFKMVSEKSVQVPMRAVESIRGAVALKGEGWYNISMKYKDVGTFGYVKNVGPFDEFWAAYWDFSDAARRAIYGEPTDFDETQFMAPNGTAVPRATPWDCVRSSMGDFFWESTALDVEFYYGRSNASVDSIADNDFNRTPSLGY